ncbi:hypothetical protein [Paenibacillus sp. URB8-2]|uniref:hypothetical protein n=1 Tax=Paenibacillus sp. URB8-2 TaxID=2741301 RepID=UPI0015BD36F3|nr:hypothetical protein [Paenibacillus sp. URB8-2]BCG60200.1 hypothetical protein PUR_36250 [Paenibacillus sp. URB8-2]
MDIHSDSYKVAALDQKDAIEIIRSAEASIAQLTGSPVTLIAYEISGDPES